MRVTDTANGNVTADVIINVSVCTAEVQIKRQYQLNRWCEPGLTQQQQPVAVLPLDRDLQLGTERSCRSYRKLIYLHMPTAAGTNTLKVTDTTNNVTDTVTITVVSGCDIDVVQDQVVRSRWVPLPALDYHSCGDDSTLNSLVPGLTIESAESALSVIKTPGKLVFPGVQTIQQLVVIDHAFSSYRC